MIPLKDHNPTRRFPILTVVLIAANLVVFFLIQRPFDRGLDDAAFTYETAAIPCEIVEGRPLTDTEILTTFGDSDGDGREDSPKDTEACGAGGDGAGDDSAFPGKNVWLAVFYSMFLHGSFLHIGGNMLYLWIFGNNIEDRMGPLAYLGFYIASGLVATVAHVLVQPNSTVPVVGASGAIAGVMGAYMVLFPDVEIRSAIILVFFFFIRDIRAKWLLGFWFVLQFLTNPASGVAWVAHVGGFVFGALVALALRRRLRPPASVPEPYF